MSEKKIIGIIPARLGSSRFPGKPLVKILEKTLLQHTYENALRCTCLEDLYVATDDERIFEHVKNFGGNCFLTSQDCANGTERLAEVLGKNPELQKAEIVVNVQGDHPCVESQTIEAIVNILKDDPTAVMSTAAAPILHYEEALSPHVVKCVFDQKGTALYFSRACIPHLQKKTFNQKSFFHHIGIYAYRTSFLMQYPSLSNTDLQLMEDLEQLKVMEHGYRIKVAKVKENVLGVDVPEDLEKVKKYLCR